MSVFGWQRRMEICGSNEMKYEITKGSEKDFEQAPEWATQLLRDNNDSKKSFVGELGGVTLVAEKMNPHSWWKYNDGYVGTIIAERRPITEPSINKSSWRETAQVGTQSVESAMKNNAQWDGEGLPPVGVKCEFSSFSLPDSWHSGIVRYLSEHTIVIELTDLVNGKAESISHPRTMKFRTIRSSEDVAREKERSEECDKIFGILSGVERTGNRSDMAEALYDAGYRKME